MSANLNIFLITEKMRERRIQLNYTQEYIAARLKISQNAYSKIECGRTNINIQRLFDIASVLETDILYFFQ